MPFVSLPSDLVGFGEDALKALDSERKQLVDRANQARLDAERLAKAQAEFEVAQRQRSTIEKEISRIPTAAGSLGAVISQLSSYIDGDVCPVCDRDFGELKSEPLVDHVHNKVRSLSAAAERLLALGRSRSEQQAMVEKLGVEIEALRARAPDAKALADMDRRAAAFEGAITEVQSLATTLAEGARLRTNDIAARRVVSEAQSRNLAMAAARETLSQFALELGRAGMAEEETVDVATARLEHDLLAETKRLEDRVILRRKANALLSTIQSNLARRNVVDTGIVDYEKKWQRVDLGLQHAQTLRYQGISIRNSVDAVRSAIIRREFNDRLNRVWRDLFVRLAPSEDFVPKFCIPPSHTQRLQPKLITEHRDGGEDGGTPGAMLSAGNLNTVTFSQMTHCRTTVTLAENHCRGPSGELSRASHFLITPNK